MTEISLALNNIGTSGIVVGLGIILLIILAAAVVVLAIFLNRQNRKLNSFLVGSDSKNIADSLKSVSADLDDLQAFKTGMEDYLTSVEKRLRRSVQSVKTVRFNPFKGTGSGGNQSFATAFLTEDGDGVVLSSLYSREHISVFSKPVHNSKPEFDLSAEEKEALEKAKAVLVAHK